MSINYIKVKVNSAIICLMCLLLLASPYIAQRVNNIIRLSLELILAILIVVKFHVSQKVAKNIFPIILYVLIMVLTTFLAHGMGSRIFNAIVTGGAYVLFYFLIITLSEKYTCKYVINIVRNNLMLYMIILDFFVIVTAGKGLGGKLEESVYLFGNKFMLSYLHMAILAFINFDSHKKISGKTKVIRIILFFLYSMLILYISDTTTGIVGCVFVAAFLLTFMKRKKIIDFLSKPIVPVLFFLGINAVFLLTDVILNNRILESFFLARSHTSTILSGRVTMYKIAMTAISHSPIWGYGLNYDIVQTTLSFGNAQNGLLKSLLDFGIVGTISFLIVLYTTFKNSEKNNETTKIGFLAFIYGMLLCSLVEINLAAIFMLVCASMNATGCSKFRYLSS